MFTKKITISLLFLAVFSVLVFATPVLFSSVFQLDTATAAAWGGGGGEGGGEGGTGGGDGCGGCGDGGDPTPDPGTDPLPPTCQYLKANGTTGTLTLPYGGGSVDLSWASSLATGATLTPDGSAVAVNGSKTVTVTTDQTYTLLVTNTDGSSSCNVVIDVEDPVIPAPSCDSFTATPNILPIGGGNTVLKWQTSNADSVTISDIGSVKKNNITGRTVSVPATKTFILTVKAAGYDDVTCPAKVTVLTPTPAPSCDSFTATPNILPIGGGNTVLKWQTSNADSVTISDIGSVKKNNITGRTVSVPATKTFILTVKAAGYDDVTCPAKVTVRTPEVITCEDNVTFTADDYELPKGGGNVILTWVTTGLDSLSINGVASTNLSDNETVNVSSDTIYTLTGIADGTKIQCPLSIYVASGGGGGGGSSSPTCDLDISDDKIKVGETVTLTWKTSRATEVKITDNHGNVLIDSDDKDDLDSELKIKPTKDTEYTLLSKKGSKERKCKIEVETENSVTVLQTRTQDPRVAGISLTTVPYTGFEAGPALTMIFYTLLTIWGLFVAYIFVIRRDSVGGVSLVGAHDHATFVDMSTAEAVEDTEAETEAESYVHAAVHTDAPVNLPVAPMIGYAAMLDLDDAVVDESIEMTELENRAHAQKVLLSSDAMRFFMHATKKGEDRNKKLDAAILEAKDSFPSEGGWVTINLARIEVLISDDIASTTVETETSPIHGGSLAEAIIDGNIVSAYQMIAHRPMIALADAASDLDAIYRSRKGETVHVSNLLTTSVAAVSTEKLEEAIDALTGALDGTYADEASAVKMAIMKAVKAVS